MTALASLATVLWWLGLCFGVVTVIAAFVCLVELLTAETVEDATAAARKNRGGRAVPSSGRAIEQGHIAHDNGGQ